MALYRFLLSEDSLSPGGWAQLMTGGANRLLFCLQGSLGLGEMGALDTHEAICTRGNTHINTGHQGAMLWRWELFPADEKIEDDVAGLTSRILLEAELQLEELEEYVFRCESLGLPPKDTLDDHRVSGSGFSALLQGNITLNRNGHLRHLDAAEAWFDDGTKAIKLSVEEEPAVVISGRILTKHLKDKASHRFIDGSNLMDGTVKRFHKITVDEIILV